MLVSAMSANGCDITEPDAPAANRSCFAWQTRSADGFDDVS